MNVKTLLMVVLDLVGAVLIVGAVAVLAAELAFTDLVRGLGAAGFGLLVVSWIADRPVRRRKGRS